MMAGAVMGLQNLSYGAFVIRDEQIISAVMVSTGITVSGTLGPMIHC